MSQNEYCPTPSATPSQVHLCRQRLKCLNARRKSHFLIAALVTKKKIAGLLYTQLESSLASYATVDRLSPTSVNVRAKERLMRVHNEWLFKRHKHDYEIISDSPVFALHSRHSLVGSPCWLCLRISGTSTRACPRCPSRHRRDHIQHVFCFGRVSEVCTVGA